MSYAVKEIYSTIQGEGYHTGRSAVFLRFAGCNLWSGLELDRSTAVCQFCDTQFVGVDGPGGGKFPDAESLAAAVLAEGARYADPGLVVMTGGEPMLQVDDALVTALHRAGYEVAIETNGTLPVVESIDWITVSPKVGAALVQTSGHELKLVYPQPLGEPDRFEHLDFRFFSLQPMDGPDRDANTRATVEYCRSHPRWRVSLQTHKYLGIP